MKKPGISALLIAFCSLISLQAAAQGDNTHAIRMSAQKGFTYKVHAGFNIGGTSPLPIPDEIQDIESYNPRLSLSIGADVHKAFNNQWGIQMGVRLENKGMKTQAYVKQYHTTITGNDGEQKTGYWTGHVKTQVNQECITIPVLATYRISPRWALKLGPYISFVIDKEFQGTTFDGYLRENTPTGDRMDVTGESTATYDFSNEMRTFQWGMQLGGEWKAFKHLNVFADLSWGLNNIFKSDFETITFNMYPIYATIGFGYTF